MTKTSFRPRGGGGGGRTGTAKQEPAHLHVKRLLKRLQRVLDDDGVRVQVQRLRGTARTKRGAARAKRGAAGSVHAPGSGAPRAGAASLWYGKVKRPCGRAWDGRA